MNNNISYEKLFCIIKGHEMFNALTEREQKILSLRYGQAKTRTLEDTGKIYGVTRERIRQIEEKAIRKLKEGITNNPI